MARTRTKLKMREKRGKQEKRRRRAGSRYYDYHLLAVVIILICFGLVMLYSASAYEAATTSWIRDDMYYFRRQAVFSAVAVLLSLLVARINYHFYIRLAPALYIIALVLMAMVKYTPFGVEAGGAKRWLNLGIQFPSEFLALMKPVEASNMAVYRLALA